MQYKCLDSSPIFKINELVAYRNSKDFKLYIGEIVEVIVERTSPESFDVKYKVLGNQSTYTIPEENLTRVRISDHLTSVKAVLD